MCLTVDNSSDEGAFPVAFILFGRICGPFLTTSNGFMHLDLSIVLGMINQIITKCVQGKTNVTNIICINMLLCLFPINQTDSLQQLTYEITNRVIRYFINLALVY